MGHCSVSALQQAQLSLISGLNWTHQRPGVQSGRERRWRMQNAAASQRNSNPLPHPMAIDHCFCPLLNNGDFLKWDKRDLLTQLTKYLGQLFKMGLFPQKQDIWLLAFSAWNADLSIMESFIICTSLLAFLNSLRAFCMSVPLVSGMTPVTRCIMLEHVNHVFSNNRIFKKGSRCQTG